MELFDTEHFITAIHNLPVIWDSRLPEYSCKVVKNKAWHEVCKIFYSDFTRKPITEQNLTVIELQKKWKSLKDSYNREKAKLKTCPSPVLTGAKPRKQYIYYNLLSFLKPLAPIRPSRRSTDSYEEEVDTEESLDSFGVTPPKSKKNKKSTDDEDAREKICEAVVEKLQRKTPTMQHPDVHFLLSLFPHLNSIKGEYKLDAKADIINLLRKYNNKGLHTPAYTSDFEQQSSQPIKTEYNNFNINDNIHVSDVVTEIYPS